MKYVLGAVLLVALVVWIFHNVRAIIRLRKEKKEAKDHADQVDGDATPVAGQETGEEKSDKQ